jgi:cobalt transporter subunit CbtA
VNRFRQLMLVVLCSGALAGLALFVIQHFTVIPLIKTAETYEAAAQHADSATTHDEEGWHPAEGWQRISLTALTTILSGIGFAAVLFGAVVLSGNRINARRGALWGLAAFLCFGLAPALGLPPQPPGTAAAGVYERQVWWIGTVIATAVGLWLLANAKRAWALRIAGVISLALPHLIGAPSASGINAVPAALVHRFTFASLATTGIFWLLLGAIGGFLYNRMETEAPLAQNA